MTLGFGVALLMLLFRKSRKLGHHLLVVIAVCCVFVSLIPVGEIGVRILEDRFPKPSFENIATQDIAGVIVLAGAVDGDQYVGRDQVEYNAAADRVLEMLALARQLPKLPVIFTGGDNVINTRKFSEAIAVRNDLDRRKLDRDNIFYEEKSRNTAENAAYSHQMIAEKWPGKADGTWILVTSARHMPRAMGVFRRYDWSIIAWPVDYIARPQRHLTDINVSHSIKMLEDALKEFVGLTAYYWTGRTTTWFPAP
ncbi:YdcF family protein [Thalassospira sp. TSL5-1]|uniref:YdcF family protein n=1 Tax=Thalassospira sp. TSL5-1 TaxID=1544451 RepID=UPI0014387A13|nr:YdcF family protein [Thalassospira sp. TSL5-1]